MKYAGKKATMMPPSKGDVEDTTVKTGTTDGKPNALGGGGRFQQMVNKGKSPALAAFIGKKLYGKKKMTQMANAGKKSA